MVSDSEVYSRLHSTCRFSRRSIAGIAVANAMNAAEITDLVYSRNAIAKDLPNAMNDTEGRYIQGYILVGIREVGLRAVAQCDERR
jgi:hypothetical protein